MTMTFLLTCLLPVFGFTVGYLLAERKNKRNVELDDATIAIIKKCWANGKISHGVVDRQGKFHIIEENKNER